MNPLAKIQGIRLQFENKDTRDYERETLGLLQGRVNEMYSMTTIAKALQIAPIAACATLYGLLAAGKISGLDIPNLRAEDDDTYFFGIIQTEHWTGGFRVEGIAECKK